MQKFSRTTFGPLSMFAPPFGPFSDHFRTTFGPLSMFRTTFYVSDHFEEEEEEEEEEETRDPSSFERGQWELSLHKASCSDNSPLIALLW